MKPCGWFARHELFRLSGCAKRRHAVDNSGCWTIWAARRAVLLIDIKAVVLMGKACLHASSKSCSLKRYATSIAVRARVSDDHSISGTRASDCTAASAQR